MHIPCYHFAAQLWSDGVKRLKVAQAMRNVVVEGSGNFYHLAFLIRIDILAAK